MRFRAASLSDDRGTNVKIKYFEANVRAKAALDTRDWFLYYFAICAVLRYFF